MVRISTTALLIAIVPAADAFIPATSTPTFIQKNSNNPTTTSLDAAPTMVIYWSIKTAFDTLMYAGEYQDVIFVHYCLTDIKKCKWNAYKWMFNWQTHQTSKLDKPMK